MSDVIDDQIVNATVAASITQFLGRESMLLDEYRWAEWFETLDEKFIYEIPIRVVKDPGEAEFLEDVFRVRDNMDMIRMRLERLASGTDWAERPLSRTVRVVGSIFVNVTEQADIYCANSATQVFRQRGQDRKWDLIAARRRDLIKVSRDKCTLVRRTIFLADTILQTPNLGIFL